MTTDLDPSLRLQQRNRFGQLSKNMFFARHVAQPRYLRFIHGAGGQRVCHVREVPIQIPVSLSDEYSISLMSDPRFQFEFPTNAYHETLLQSYNDRIQLKKRRERLLPPIPGWSPTGTVNCFLSRCHQHDRTKSSCFLLVEDTEHWRRELARISEMVGLVTPDELIDLEARKESPLTPIFKARPSTGQYSRQTGRWNETPKSASGNRSRSAHRRTPMTTATQANHLFCVDEHEREMWMLQVLCQILQTDSLNEIQSWLVSSGPNEKEAVRQLITTAIRGLEENGRIPSSFNGDENAKGVQVNMDPLGSLLAAKFPQVLSLKPNNDTPLRSRSRPKTAPLTPGKFESKSAMQFTSKTESRISIQSPAKVESRTETNTKGLATPIIVPTAPLPSIEDVLEKKPVHYVATTEPSTKPLNIVHDVQVLTLTDDKEETVELKTPPETVEIETTKVEDEVPF